MTKIGVDASRYKIKTPTGIEWYSYHLLNNLIPRLGREHNSKVLLFLRQPQKFKTRLPFNVKKRVIPMRRLWTLARLSAEILRSRLDLLFVPSHVLPLITPRKTVITIHDLAFKDPKLKDTYKFKERLLLNISTRRAVWTASKIIVPSEATKDDLIKYYRCKPEKIKVIYHGAPELSGKRNPLLKKWKKTEKEEMFKRLGLTGKDLYALFVGRIEKKKNCVNLVEAFARFLKEYPDWKLVLAGKDGVGADKIHAKIAELKLEESVIRPGYITEKEKDFLYHHCRLVTFPSFYEGFGLPILEGFAFRKPVLTSKTTSMPEVGGDAAYYVDPEKVPEISVGMKRLVSDGMLVNQMINKGEEQLKKFSWEKAAEETFEVLFDCL